MRTDSTAADLVRSRTLPLNPVLNLDVDAAALAMSGLAPLFMEPPDALPPGAWWQHAPFLQWLLAMAKPKRAMGAGEAFDGIRGLALRLGQTLEWGGAASMEPADLLVLDGPWGASPAAHGIADWRQRLAPGAVVLMHGVHPGYGAASIWARWLEEVPEVQSIVLPSGSGLGLLLHGPSGSGPAPLRTLCDLPPEIATAFVRRCATLGALWTARQRETELQAHNAELLRAIPRLRQSEAEAHREVSRLEEAQQETLAAERSRFEAVRRELAEALAAERFRADAAERAAAVAAERATASITNSTSWRIAAVLARLCRRLPRPARRMAGQAARGTWWLVTGQLRRRLGQRRVLSRQVAMLRSSMFFDAEWYGQHHVDVGSSGMDPAAHFLLHGAGEGREPGPAFDANWYAARYPDVAASGQHPLLHFLAHGAAEGREWRPVMSCVIPSGGHQAQGAAPAGSTAPCAATEASAPDLAMLSRRLGRSLPPVTIFPVTVGFALRSTPLPRLLAALESAETALQRIGQAGAGRRLVVDDGAAFDPSLLCPWPVSCLPPSGAVGFGAAHNRAMEAAFAAGAEVYVAAHPAGIFDPDSLVELLRMVRAASLRALVEAAPVRGQVPPEPGSLDPPSAPGNCLAVPRLVHEAIGGFDEQFGAYGGAMDLSWRARAAGFAILSCPYAVFRMPAEEAPALAPSPAVLTDALALARKWGLNSAEADITSKLRWIGHPVPATPEGRMAAAQREAAQPERTLRLREPSW